MQKPCIGAYTLPGLPCRLLQMPARGCPIPQSRQEALPDPILSHIQLESVPVRDKQLAVPNQRHGFRSLGSASLAHTLVCLRHTCAQLGVASPAVLSLPRFCTCRSEWAAQANGDSWLSLAGLCAMFGVKQSRAHAAEADALALAQCLSKALKSQPGQSLELGERLREVLASGSP